MDDHRAVVDPMPVPQRCAQHEHRQQSRRSGHDLAERHHDLVEQRVLQQQVLDRVPGEAQLGEHGHGDALLRAPASLPQDGLGVGARLGDHGLDRARRDARETMPIDGPEVQRLPRGEEGGRES